MWSSDPLSSSCSSRQYWCFYRVLFPSLHQSWCFCSVLSPSPYSRVAPMTLRGLLPELQKVLLHDWPPADFQRNSVIWTFPLPLRPFVFWLLGNHWGELRASCFKLVHLCLVNRSRPVTLSCVELKLMKNFDVREAEIIASSNLKISNIQ